VTTYAVTGISFDSSEVRSALSACAIGEWYSIKRFASAL
jgi:hypothetical protein